MQVILFVHGAGSQAPNYFKEPLNALTALLGSEPPHTAVYYADVMNPAPKTRKTAAAHKKKKTTRATADGDEATYFKMAFAMLVQGDFDSLPQSERHTAVFALPGQFLAELIANELNEMAGYLFSSKTHEAIQQRMRDGLANAVELGDEIVIAAHSLGSIVAFDALHDLASPHRVSAFFTLGSPLSKLRRLNIRGPDFGAIPDSVSEWFNLYDTTDPIANVLGPAFPSRPLRLRDVFVDVNTDPIRSHDYFRNPETLAELAAALL